MPPLRLSSKVPRPVSPEVVQDIAFMSYLNKSFALCGATKLIQKRLAAREPCWEKRWATMLAGWERSRDIQWEDLPVFPHMPVKSELPLSLLMQISPATQRQSNLSSPSTSPLSL